MNTKCCAVVKGLGATLKSKSARTLLKLEKNSPEIMVGAGVVAIVGGVVLACKATLKVEDILEESEETIEKIHEAEGMPNYSKKDYKRDLTLTYVQTGAKLAKNYAPAVIVTGLGIGLILGSHNILKKRNVALMASYKTLDKAFDEYRGRVIREYGEDVDKLLKNDLVKKEVIDEDGNKTVEYEKRDPNVKSQYGVWFDEFSQNHKNSASANRMFLQMMESYANDKLVANGHLFLNEVYDMIGVPRTKAGSLVGWVYGNGDDYVSFDLFSPDSDSRVFINGYENSIFLDFNVDGVIYDLI